jgi:SP family general alpha glucoside:H+ symporter-like MFS transporter
MCSIALYELNANLPYNWKIAIYTQFAMIGTSLIIFIFLPESTCTSPTIDSTLTRVGWLVSKGKIERARKTLEYRFGAIPGYDIDGELSIIAVTIEKQRHWDREAKAEGPLAIFKGLNGKRFLIGSWPKVGWAIYGARTS